ncbi:unnamed protein product [Mytilus edulis]|uniref:Uncharacterized protein n=1 Tax=Mytilus edulis TaxID=6550 RepID=A0A8S3UBK8_MYTED|nr:unnamed protein product [Mytilus edulis]
MLPGFFLPLELVASARTSVNIHGKSLNKEPNTVSKLLPGERSIPQTNDTKQDKIDTVSSAIQDSDVFSNTLDTQVCQRRQFLKRRQVDLFLQVEQKCLKITAEQNVMNHEHSYSSSPSSNEKQKASTHGPQIDRVGVIRENKDDILKLAERSKDKKRKLEKKERLGLQELLVIRKNNTHIQSTIPKKKDHVTKSTDNLKDRKRKQDQKSTLTVEEQQNFTVKNRQTKSSWRQQKDHVTKSKDELKDRKRKQDQKSTLIFEEQ